MKDPEHGDSEGRRRAMAIFAAATAEELHAAVGRLLEAGGAEDLKAPEVGLIMLRGRIGGDGASFNIAEATVARAVVRLASGEIGYGIRLGRNTTAARDAAILDALWQRRSTRKDVESGVLNPIAGRLQAEREASSRQAAATRVEFFTLAREAT